MEIAPSSVQCYAIRLSPGDEICENLFKLVKEKCLRAPFIMSCVGSVTQATLRLAHSDDGNKIHEVKGCHEIVSLVGTLADEGHIHASLSDAEGNVIGGHVMGNMVVFTTAEIIIGDCASLVFKREMDSTTGFDELTVKDRTMQQQWSYYSND